MMSSKNNGFTAGDIERYHSGKMSPEERHALEKAALDDLFLADALEGYAFTSTPSIDLAKIQSRLNEKLNQKKVVPIFQKYKWLSVAAIVLVIAGAGWLAYSISDREKDSFTIAKKENQIVKDSSQKLTAQDNVIDSMNTISDLKSQPPTTTQQSQASTKPNEANNSFAIKPQRQLNKDKEVAESKKEFVTEVNAPATVQNEMTTNNSIANVEQRNVARNNTIYPDPKAINKSEGLISKAPAYKDIASNNAPVSGRVSGIRTNDTIKNVDVVMQPLPMDSSSLQEVVVGYGTSRKKSNDKYPRVIIDKLEPAEGYVSFDTYVANNLKMPEGYKTKTSPGEVQLSFDVDKDGQPVNITVVKSLCEKCDEEAIRLLKEGPKWKKKKNKKGKITIKF
jgi:hypothetical protein